jgi:nucleotide-binding universal stress UspA family protein
MKKPNILVPIDFSDLSRRALRAANQWARMFGAQVTPMHAYEPVTDLDGFHFYGPEESVAGDLIAVETTVRRLLDEYARQDVEAAHLREGVFVLGNPARSIARASLNYDLIVISSHGRSGFARFFLGSVTDKVIRLSPTPVLVAADEAALLPLERILVPTDLSLNSEAAFPFAREVAKVTGAAVHLLYIHMCDSAEAISTEALESRLRAFAGPHFEGVPGPVEASVLVTGGSAHEGIYHFVQEKKCNLVVMTTAGKSGIEHLLLGGTAAQVVHAVQTAVLLVNPEHQRELKLAGLKAR